MEESSASERAGRTHGVVGLRSVLAVVVLVSACAAYGTTPRCQVGADCDSGVCNVDGTCADVSSLSTGGGSTSSSSSSSSSNAWNWPDCHSGTNMCIARMVWDFSEVSAGDELSIIQATSLEGQWYEASYPDGQWAAPADTEGTTQGIYSTDGQAIYLLGLASVVESPPTGQTLLAYDEKVAVYRFPLTPGTSFTSVGNVTANGSMVGGLPYKGTHTYEVKDDAVGKLKTSTLTFCEVHRVRTKLTMTGPVGPAATVRRQTGFVYECYGEVVRATADGDGSDDFMTADELRRLKLQD